METLDFWSQFQRAMGTVEDERYFIFKAIWLLHCDIEKLKPVSSGEDRYP